MQIRQQPVAVMSPHYALILLTLLNLINFADRYAPSAYKDLLIADLHMSDTQSSLPMSAFILVYIVTSPLFTMLHDKYRITRVRIICAAAIIWSLCTVLSSLCTTFTTYLITRALVGMGEAGYTTLSSSLLCDLYPVETRTTALTIYYIATPVGAATGFTVGGYMAQTYGWRAAFCVCGVPGLLLAVCMLFVSEPPVGQSDNHAPQYITDNVTPAQHTNEHNAGQLDKLEAMPDTNVRLLHVQPAATQQVDEPVTWRHTITTLAHTPVWIYCIIGAIAVVFGAGGVADWIPTYYVRTYGADYKSTGLYVGAITVVSGVCGTMTGTYVSERVMNSGVKQHTAYTMVCGSALCVAALASAGTLLVSDMTVSYCMLFVSQYCMWWYTAPINTVKLNCVTAQLRNQSVALQILLIHVLGDAVSPVVMGGIADATGSVLMALTVVPAAFLLGGSVWLLGAWMTRDSSSSGGGPMGGQVKNGEVYSKLLPGASSSNGQIGDHSTAQAV